MGVNKINVNNTDSNYTHSIFDISEYTGKTYDTLADALADVPDGKQKGGMTISFVDSSDNKYVQFRFTLSSFTNTQFINEVYWQEDSVDKLIQIDAWGTNWTGQITEVGQVGYNPSNKDLKRCVVFNTTALDSVYENIPKSEEAIYIYNSELYVWNGTDLVKRGHNIQVSEDTFTKGLNVDLGIDNIFDLAKQNFVSDLIRYNNKYWNSNFNNPTLSNSQYLKCSDLILLSEIDITNGIIVLSGSLGSTTIPSAIFFNEDKIKVGTYNEMVTNGGFIPANEIPQDAVYVAFNMRNADTKKLCIYGYGVLNDIILERTGFIITPNTSSLSIVYENEKWYLRASASSFILCDTFRGYKVLNQVANIEIPQRTYALLAFDSSGNIYVTINLLPNQTPFGILYCNNSYISSYVRGQYNINGKPYNIDGFISNIANISNGVYYIYDEWQPNTTYKVGDNFSHNGKNYLTVFSFNSGSEWGSETTNHAIEITYIQDTLDIANFTKGSTTGIVKTHKFVSQIINYVQKDGVGANIGELVYLSDAKILAKKKTDAEVSYWFQRWDFVPYYNDTLYIYNNGIYLWNGTKLVNDAEQQIELYSYDYHDSYPIIPNELYVLDDCPTPLYKYSMFLKPAHTCNMVLTTTINNRHRAFDVMNPLNIEHDSIGDSAKITLEKNSDVTTNLFKDITINKGSVAAKSGKSIKVLMIGDSITHGDNGANSSPIVVMNSLLPSRYNISVSMIGTFAPFGVYGEGRGTWSYEAAVGIDNNPYGSYHFPSVGGDLEGHTPVTPTKNANPFTFPATASDLENYPEICFTNNNNYPDETDGVSYADATAEQKANWHFFIFDFARYLALWNDAAHTPDIITIALGTNDWWPATQINLENTLRSVDIMYNRIRAALPTVKIAFVSAYNIAITFQDDLRGNWETEISPLLLGIQKKVATWRLTDTNVHELPIYANGSRWLAFDGHTAGTPQNLSEDNNVQQQTIDANVHLLDGVGSDGYWECMDAIATALVCLTDDN